VDSKTTTTIKQQQQHQRCLVEIESRLVELGGIVVLFIVIVLTQGINSNYFWIIPNVVFAIFRQEIGTSGIRHTSVDMLRQSKLDSGTIVIPRSRHWTQAMDRWANTSSLLKIIDWRLVMKIGVHPSGCMGISGT
jgi:hypothetical protein